MRYSIVFGSWFWHPYQRYNLFMLDRSYLSSKTEQLRQGLASRGEDPGLVDQLLQLDAKRKRLITEASRLRAERNRLSKQVAETKKKGQDASHLIQEVRAISERLKQLEQEEKQAEQEFNSLWSSLPNIPHPSVPVGKDEGENQVLRQEGQKPVFDFKPMPHWDIGPLLGVLDFETASRLSGSRFVMFKSAGSRLVRGLINFFLDVNTAEFGYTEVMPPVLVRAEAAFGSGHLPKFRDEMYYTGDDDGLFLVPTAELPLANLHAGQTLKEQDLPLKYTAYTPCFRREAGSYGRDVRGMIRVHQFDKVELFRYTHPDSSYQALEEMLAEVETLLKRLGLTYRVVELCTGDLGAAAAKTYDLEVWAPGVERWLEVSSVSNTEDFQARRSGTRLRFSDGNTGYPHTLNGSGLALARIIVAILENYQMKNGVVRVPDALVPYTGIEVIRP